MFQSFHYPSETSTLKKSFGQSAALKKEHHGIRHCMRNSKNIQAQTETCMLTILVQLSSGTFP